MIFERIKSEGLAQNSYFVGSGSSAAVIDPRRDTQVYLDLARRHEMRIRTIFETHRNEDYVIGSLQLSSETGANIFHGPGLDWGYGETLKDGQEFGLGALQLTALRTPGHTDESVSYVLRDLKTGKVPIMAFCGDALFVSDTGRIDLYGPLQSERLASSLYDSLFQRLLPLGDGTILCPAHGAGSLCGANIADRDDSTLGIERLQNPGLQVAGKSEFVKRKMAETLERPPYFKQMETFNRAGPPLLKKFPSPPALAPAEFAKEIEQGALLLDASEPAAFAGAHIPGAYSIWLEGVSHFPGWFFPYGRPILLVLGDPAQLDAAVKFLVRLGYDDIGGYLRGGIEGWYNSARPIQSLGALSVQSLKEKLDGREDLTVLDVRDEAEWESGHIQGAQHIYVGHIEERISEISRNRPVAVLCHVGRRASIAASLLQRAGFKNIYNVLGSITAWRNAGYPLTRE